jgi:HD-GYP domain-containing protein (c-di-GMP phosphodiesterase class II)
LGRDQKTSRDRVEEEIPLQARIISVIDAYDAMTDDRGYQRVLSKQEAIEEILRCSGSQFDPQVASIFVKKILKQNV